eukprot:6201126-Pleurochrysis_carterae.AAC.2
MVEDYTMLSTVLYPYPQEVEHIQLCSHSQILTSRHSCLQSAAELLCRRERCRFTSYLPIGVWLCARCVLRQPLPTYAPRFRDLASRNVLTESGKIELALFLQSHASLLAPTCEGT